MIALIGAKSIKVAKYALYGSKSLSKNILEAMENSKGCLISNHGQVTVGDGIGEAYELAEEVELLCEYYYHCKLYKEPKIISKKEMNMVLEKILNYKKK